MLRRSPAFAQTGFGHGAPQFAILRGDVFEDGDEEVFRTLAAKE